MVDVKLKDYETKSQDFYEPINITLDSPVPQETGIQSTVMTQQPQMSTAGRPMADVLTSANYGNVSMGGTPVFKAYSMGDPDEYGVFLKDKAFDFGAELKKLNAGDKSGPWTDDNVAQTLGSAGLAIGSTTQTLGSTLGMMSILNAKAGVPNPVTGEKSISLVPFLDNIVMKERYNALKNIKAYTGTDSYDIFRLGIHTFVREPGEFRFRGNVSALGIDHADLHKIVAVSKGEDPRDYDYKTGKSSRSQILTYGSGLAGGYTLDGGHVDNRGIYASAGRGASDEFIQMAAKYFNGNTAVAREWLTSTAAIRKSSFFGGQSYNKTEQAQLLANLNKYIVKAGGKPLGPEQEDTRGGGEDQLSGTGVVDSTNKSKIQDGIIDFTDEPNYQKFSPAGPDFSGMRMYDPNTRQLSTANQGGEGTRELLDSFIRPTETGLQTGTGDPEPTREFTDIPNYTRFVDYTNMRMYGTIPDPNAISVVGGSQGKTTDIFNSVIQSKTSAAELMGGVDSSLFDKIKNRAKSFANKYIVGNYFKSPSDPLSIDNIITKQTTNNTNDDKSNTNTGTTIGSDFQKIDDFTGGETDETGFGGDFAFQKGGLVNMQNGGTPQAQQAQLVGGVSPTEIPEEQTVADDQARTVQDKSFIMNAPSVEKIILSPEAINVAGVQDVRKMILDAYSFAKEKGMDIGNVDRKLYEGSVDVALSKGELIIPPDLVKVIGKDRLEKINNRGKKEVTKRARASGQENTGGNQFGGFPTGSDIMSGLKSIGQRMFNDHMQLSPVQPATRIQSESTSGFLKDPTDMSNIITTEEKKSRPVKKKVKPDYAGLGQGFIDYTQQPDFDGTYSLSEIEGITFEDLIFNIEGNKGAGYVPKDSPNSGVTIGMGVDVGQHSVKDFKRYGVPTNIIEKLKPYFGVTGEKAKQLIKDQTVTLSGDEVRDLNNVIISQKYKEFENFLERRYPALTKATEKDKGVLYTIYYHGSFPHKKGGKTVGYKSFIDDFTEIVQSNSYVDGDIIKSIEENVFPKISRKGSDRNRLNKVINWYRGKSQNVPLPVFKP